MKRIHVFLFPSLIMLMSGLLPVFTSMVSADSALLKGIIVDFNQELHKKSLEDGSYRGEEGVLRLRPEVAETLGLNVFINQDYIDSQKLFEKAGRTLDKAWRAMITEEKERFHGEHIRQIAEQVLLFKDANASAQKKLQVYRARLSEHHDDRFNNEMMRQVLDDLLVKCLDRTDRKLRDALGCFYNQSQGVEQKRFPLTPENIHFVNEIFHQFVWRTKADDKRGFCLDGSLELGNKTMTGNWRAVVEKQCSPYIPFIESALEKYAEKRNGMNPLLLVALMKRESAFDPLAISSAGAAGLMQIMPSTAKDLGMENIYSPTYFNEAMQLSSDGRKYKKEAMTALLLIDDENKVDLAATARSLMQKSVSLNKEKERLLARYRSELLKQRNDDRLHPNKVIEYGCKYLSGLLREHKGDISLALASYNAGPHRIEQYNGIPPFEETVKFRNVVLQYYEEYLQRAEGKDL